MKVRGERLKAWRRRRRGTIALEDRSLTANTRVRYFNAVRKVVPILEASSVPWDETLVAWIDEQYLSGEGITGVGDALCGLQHFAPFCKGHLCQAWKLYRVWCKVEKPRQAPPLPYIVFLGILGRSVEQESIRMTALLALGFWGMLRTGELLKLQFRHILLAGDTAVVQLGQTKTGLRRAVDENVVLYDTVPRLILSTLMDIHKDSSPRATIWPYSAQEFRDQYKQLLNFFCIGQIFRPYSLRRGGATEDFRVHGLMERTLIRGRWGTSTAARQYIQEGLSALTGIHIPPKFLKLLKQYAVFYFSDLAPARSDPGDVEETGRRNPVKKRDGSKKQC